jgi:PKD repeat protein
MKNKMTPFVLFLSLLFVLFGSAAFSADNVSRSPDWDSTCPRMVVDSLGNIHVAWAEIYEESVGEAYYAKYDIITKKWSNPLELSNNGLVYSGEGRAVGIDIDPQDNIYVTYGEGPQVSMRIFSGGTWGAPITVHSWDYGEADSARVAVDAKGNIFVVWWSTGSYTVHSRARIDGNWEGVKTLSPPGQFAKLPDISVGKDSVFACWTGRGDFYQIFYTRRATTAGASWTPAQYVLQASRRQQAPAVAVDNSDVAHVVFTPVWDDEGGTRMVRYTYWTGAGFAPFVPLSSQTLLHYPYISEKGGNVYVCWQVGAVFWGTIYYNYNIGGAWTGEKMVPGSGGSTFSDVAVSPAMDRAYHVWDSGGEIWCDVNGIILGPPNDPPVANFTFSPTTGVSPLTVNFDASASYDSDGTISLCTWDFGDGKSDTGMTVSHVYETWGTFTITLSVRDNRGATAAKTASITVQRLAQPINIRWESHVDESLFFTRYVNEIKWDPNPLNSSSGVQIVLHRIWRKNVGEPNSAYKVIGEVTANVYSYQDKDVKGKNLHTYTVTVVDSQGNESPISPSGSFSPARSTEGRTVQGVQRKGNPRGF